MADEKLGAGVYYYLLRIIECLNKFILFVPNNPDLEY